MKHKCGSHLVPLPPFLGPSSPRGESVRPADRTGLLARNDKEKGRAASFIAESLCQFLPANFTALIHRNCIGNKNPLRHLGSTQGSPAKRQQIAFSHVWFGDHANSD